MPSKRKGGFFGGEARPEDEEARRGDLEALITNRPSVPREIGIERIVPNPFQARTDFTGIEELADAIKAHGFTSRLRVREHPSRPGYFQLVYGERRLRAAQAAGLSEVPCEVAAHTDADMVEIGLAENIQRRDLAPLEEARAFQTFISERNYSIRGLAERIGKDKSYVEDRLKLLEIPEDVQEMVAERPDSLRAAREIAKVAAPEARAPLIAGVVSGALSTADIRARVAEAVLQPAPHTSKLPAPNPRLIVERDARTMHAILARWGELATQSESARQAIDAKTEELLRAVQQLVDTLEQ